MGRIIAIANQKGGVGKTTTAINLSACLAEAKQRVLVIDIDPQGNTTSGLGIDKEEKENTIYEVMLGEISIEQAICKEAFDCLDVIPSNVNLAGAEIDLIDIEDREYILKKSDNKVILTEVDDELFFQDSSTREEFEMLKAYKKEQEEKLKN